MPSADVTCLNIQLYALRFDLKVARTQECLLVFFQTFSGGPVASWLVPSSADRAVRVRALAGDTVLRW